MGKLKEEEYLTEVNLLCFVDFALWFIRKGDQFFLNKTKNQKGNVLLLALIEI